MRKIILAFSAVLAATWMISCSDNEIEYIEPVITYDTTSVVTTEGQEKFLYEDLFILNEGNWQSDNGQLSVLSGKSWNVTNAVFKDVNGFKLGDTPKDIIQVNDTLYAISVNTSNLIQFIRPDGTACGATEDVPNCRHLCVDDESNLYVTSYAHSCNGEVFTKGFVAKIDPLTKKVVSTVEVGWEPEGIKYYNGKLFVMNSGGYAYSESHDYENTVSVVDCSSMQVIQTIELVTQEGVKALNLYGSVAQSGKYLCINASGDYHTNPAMTVVLNCEDYSYRIYDFPSNLSSTSNGKFKIIGSAFSYVTYEYEYTLCQINPETGEVSEGLGNKVLEDKITSLSAPYVYYISPYSNNEYITDACNYSSAGKLYAVSSYGSLLVNGESTYICPGSMIAVPHYTIEETYSTTIIITPHVEYPKTRAFDNSFDVDSYNRGKFLEAWKKSTGN